MRCSAILVAALAAGSGAFGGEAEPWATAARNADQANEALVRCHRLVVAWYQHKGTGNFLLPQNLRSRQWNGHNSAADLWSFFVLTACLTDQGDIAPLVRQTLADDIRLATRVGSMTADFDIDRNAFVRREPSLPALLFSSSEYVKDGLLPIIELTGQTVYFDRARDLVADIFANVPVETKFGKIPSDGAELNGNMLQSLSRLYRATRDPRFKEWVFRIADAYFLDALPRCNDLPCHSWDFAAGKPRTDLLSLSDHGNEVIFGLSEAMVLAHAEDPERAPKYTAAMKRMVDKLLAIAVNDHGLWFHSIQPSTGKVINRATPDTWGYALDAVYALHMVTGEAQYREAVARALKGINADPKYLNWGGSDAFADSIESGIVLLNRIPEPEGFAWLEKVVPVFLGKQRPDGIVEGWHGDGNYARTALMYALMKTAGTRVEPWRPDLKLGAVVQDNTLYVQLTADKPWDGRLFFDYPRHRCHLGLPMNYPRLNEFPEWYPIEPARSYLVAINGSKATRQPGYELIWGLDLSVAEKPVQIVVEPVPGPLPEHPAIPAHPPIEAIQVLPDAGVLLDPRTGEQKVEASVEGQRLSLRIVSARPWEGKLQFDFPRGLLWLGRRLARPAEWPADPWYAIESTRLYQVTVGGKALEPILGDDLMRGLPAKADGNGTAIVVEPLPGPPYGGRAIVLEAPSAVAGDGPVRVPLTVRNETRARAEVSLRTSFGQIAPDRLALDQGQAAEAVLTGTLSEAGEARIEVVGSAGQPLALRTIRLVHDRDLVGLKTFADQDYKGTGYAWCGAGPIEFALPARPGQPHTLRLLWGSKGDERKARLTIDGKSQEVSQGGYDGFKWLTIPIDLVKTDKVAVRLDALGDKGAAFIAEARLTSP